VQDLSDWTKWTLIDTGVSHATSLVLGRPQLLVSNGQPVLLFAEDNAGTRQVVMLHTLDNTGLSGCGTVSYIVSV
jgi:hypothetical protein